MSADQVTPVTSNEREMQSGGACGLHGVYVGRRCPRCAQISEVEGTVPSAWYLDMKRERDRLVAALSAATTERDEALAQVGAATTILAEAEKIIPGIITTAGRFAIGLNDRERAVAAEEALAQAWEALDKVEELRDRELRLYRECVEENSHAEAARYDARQSAYANAIHLLGAALSRRPTVQEQDEAEAEREFLTASVAVWRSIDEREAMPGGYSAQPLMQDTELRKVERAAWERYRDACAAAGGAADKPTLNEPESKLKPLIGPGPSEGGCDDSANAKRPSAPGSLSAAADRPERGET